MVLGVTRDIGLLLGGEYFAYPRPVERHPVIYLNRIGEPPARDLAHHTLSLRGAEDQFAVLQKQRLPVDEQLSSIDRHHLTPTDAAAVKRVQRMFELANATVDIEHVETVVRPGAGGRLAQDQLAGSALELLAESIEEVIVQLAHLDSIEQRVADPVCVHHAC